jgi:4-coumarate--CoA ligase
MEHVFNRIQTFHDLGLFLFGHHNQKIAFQDSENSNETVKYIDLLKTSRQVGNFLQNEFGLKHQEVVATLLPNIWQYFPIHTGISQIGGILTGLSPQFTPFEISHQLRDSDAVIAFVGPEFLTSVFKIVHECPELRAIVVIGDFKPPTKRFPIPVYLWNDITRHPSTPPILSTPIDPNEDLCWLPYSSGTTGLPKGVMHTHRGFMLHLKAQIKHANDVVNVAHEIPVSDFHPSFLPVYHAMGFFGMLFALAKGQTIILLKKYSFKRLLELTEKYKFTAIMGAPSIAHQFVKDPIVKKFDLSSVKILGSGGSKLDDPTIKEIEKRFPHIERIGQGYGMTEAVTGIVMATRRKEEPIGSVGIPIMGVEVKVKIG